MGVELLDAGEPSGAQVGVLEPPEGVGSGASGGTSSEGLLHFLGTARRRLERRRAVVWAVRGLAVAGAGALLVELAVRRWPLVSTVPALALVGLLAGLAATAGWWWDRPSLAEVASVADRSLGGSERLTTALELAGREDVPAWRQRADAEGWLSAADPTRVAVAGLPRPALFAGLAAMVLAGLLALLPNPALARAHADQRAEAARARAADEIAALGGELGQGHPGEDPGRRQALARELRTTEDALRRADSTTRGVAALSRAQASLRSLTDPAGTDRHSATAAAGAQLAQAGPAAAAGAALSKLASPGGRAQEAAAGAEASLRPEEQAQTGADAGAQDQQASAKAAAELSALAQSLPGLTPEQQAQLAQALERAAAAAAADPELAAELRKAADAARQDRPEEAAAALDAAGKRAESLSTDRALDRDVARASNEMEAVKDKLLKDLPTGSEGSSKPCPESSKPAGPAPGPTSSIPGDAAQAPAPPPTQAVDCTKSRSKSKSQGQKSSASPGEAGKKAQSKDGDQSGEQGSQRGQSGAKGQGEGGKEQGEGGGQGQAQGKSSGSERGGGSHRGGGSTGGGAEGGLNQGPGRPNERVYVPSAPGAGRSQGLPSEGGSQGADTAAVPYETVYGQYRKEALSDADRRLMPEQLQDLLRRYFQEATP